MYSKYQKKAIAYLLLDWFSSVSSTALYTNLGHWEMKPKPLDVMVRGIQNYQLVKESNIKYGILSIEISIK